MKRESEEIPKIIHYCWFGGKEKPMKVQKCISSWKQYCKGYELKEWNESNFNIEECAYVFDAYMKKSWAFVSDYVRFAVLYRYGGVYFDTDVELLKPIDEIIEKGAFMGREPLDKDVEIDGKQIHFAVAPGLGIAFEPRSSFCKEMLQGYCNDSFIDVNGKINSETVVSRATKILLRSGLNDEDVIQKIDNIWIYPTDYFCPLNYNTGELRLTENTYSIHHYMSTWLNWSEKLLMRLHRAMYNKGTKGRVVEEVLALPLKLVRKVSRMGIKKASKHL